MTETGIDMRYFSRKKTLVSFVLSVLIVFRHTTSFAIYGELPLGIDLMQDFLKSAITPSAVPLFFILSGALFYRDYTPEKFGEKIRRRIHSLLIPYLCWNVINMLIEIAETLLLGRFYVGREKMVITPVNLLLGVVHYEYNGPFWFIFALICFSVCAPVIDLAIRNKYVGILLTATVAVLAHFGIGLPGSLFFTKTCIVYYLVGALIGRFWWERFASVSSGKLCAVSGVYLIIAAGVSLYLKQQELHFPTIVSEVFLILSALCIWICADSVVQGRQKNYPDYMTHSFFVYAMHMNLCAGFARVVYYIFPRHWAMAPVNFLLTMAIVFSIIEITCWVLKKISPAVYRMLSGARAE